LNNFFAMSKFIKPINQLEFWRGDQTLPPGHKLQWHDRKLVALDVGSEFQQFLAELKETNKILNRLFEAKLQAAGLPFSTKPDKEIFQLTLRFAPPYTSPFEQTKSELEAKAAKGERYSPSADEIIFYLHVDEDQQFHGARTVAYDALRLGAITDSLTNQGINSFHLDAALTALIKNQDVSGITDLLIKRLQKSGEVKNILAYTDVSTVEEARVNFAQPYFSNFNRTIYRNFAEAMLLKILRHEIDSYITEPSLTPKEKEATAAQQKNRLLEIILEFTKIKIGSYHPIDMETILSPNISLKNLDLDKLSAEDIEHYVNIQTRAYYYSLIKRAEDEAKSQRSAPKK